MQNSNSFLYFLNFLFLFIFILAIYLYSAYCLARISKKLNTPKTWKAWLPVVNLFYLIKLAGKSYWWFLLLFIPIANIVFIALIWANVARRLSRSRWHGLLLLIPLVQLIDIGYLAIFNKEVLTVPKNVNSELVDYLKQHLAQGFSVEELLRVLIDVGWKKDAIDNALNKVMD